MSAFGDGGLGIRILELGFWDGSLEDGIHCAY